MVTGLQVQACMVTVNNMYTTLVSSVLYTHNNTTYKTKTVYKQTIKEGLDAGCEKTYL